MKSLTVTDVLAIIGAVTGVLGTVLAIFALLWDYYKWRYSERVQLNVSANPNFTSNANPHDRMIMVSVTNAGIPTTIKLLTLHGYNSKKSLKKRNGESIRVVNGLMYGQLPVKLNPTDDWFGGINQRTPDIPAYLDYEYFVIQVEDTMSEIYGKEEKHWLGVELSAALALLGKPQLPIA